LHYFQDIDLLIHNIHIRECQKTLSKTTDRKPYFSDILEEEFEVSENISFLTPLFIILAKNNFLG
jgi:hypothetical protein